MTTISADTFFGGKVPTTPIPVVGKDSQLLEPTTHEEATQSNFFTDIKDIGTGIKENFLKNRDKAAQTTADYKAGKQGIASSFLQAVGQAANVLGNAVGETVIGVGKAVLPKKAEDAIGGAVQKLVGSVLETDTAQQVMEKYKAWEAENPVAAKDLGAVVDIASILPIGEVAGAAKNVAVDATKSVASKVAKTAIGAADITKEVADTAIAKVIPQTAKENVARVLTNTGKKSLKDAATNASVTSATEALDLIRKNAPNIKITDFDGVEKVFDPAKATFQELPQALKQTKDTIYKQYTDLAKEAGDNGLKINRKDFAELNAELDKYSGKGYTAAFQKKASDLKSALARFKGNATPEEMQNLIEKVNIDVNLGSDKAAAQVSNDFSKALRDKLDAKLEASGNPNYQALRDQYSKLKSIESDVLSRYKQAMRKAGVKPDIIDGVISLDALQGILTLNPSNIGRSIGAGTIKKIITYLKDPEVNLQRAFKILGKPEVAPVVKQGTETVVKDLTKTADVVDEIKQSGGITVDKAGVTPQKGYSVAPSKKTETIIPAANFTEQSVEEFKKKFAKELAKPDAHLGAWTNDNGDIVLDVSHVVTDFKTAIETAKKGKQDAIWDIANGKTINLSEILTPSKGRKAGVLKKELKAREVK